ncbi:MAG: polyphosphate polymerase domain-containing protein [Lachnospiraceae bacterium]|nr:polyphosphate polymerase domain-containing protein [Lachnospiraceae bacterium]
MSDYINVFQRTEMKYQLSTKQYEQLILFLEKIATVDKYGLTKINNIYFDTPNYKLIRQSLEKPLYKEKLRLRTYGTTKDSTNAFIEIKKKYKGIVYKRRVSASYKEAYDYLVNGTKLKQQNQIIKEIDYFLHLYQGLQPTMKITYDRVAWIGKNDPSLRITIDSNIQWSTKNLDLKSDADGKAILDEGEYMMEIKVTNGMPVDLAKKLSELKIFPSSFSKYGRSYIDLMSGKYHYYLKSNVEKEYAEIKRGVLAYE